MNEAFNFSRVLFMASPTPNKRPNSISQSIKLSCLSFVQSICLFAFNLIIFELEATVFGFVFPKLKINSAPDRRI